MEKKSFRPLPEGLHEFNSTRQLRTSTLQFPELLLNALERSTGGMQYNDIIEESKKWKLDGDDPLTYLKTISTTFDLEGDGFSKMNIHTLLENCGEGWSLAGSFPYPLSGKHLFVRNIAIHQDSLLCINGLDLFCSGNWIDGIDYRVIHFFGVLQAIHGVEKLVDEEGYCVIPLHLNLLGIPSLGFHIPYLQVSSTILALDGQSPRSGISNTIKVKYDPRSDLLHGISNTIKVKYDIWYKKIASPYSAIFPIMQNQFKIGGLNHRDKISANHVCSYLVYEFCSEDDVFDCISLEHSNGLGPIDHPLLLKFGSFGVYDMFLINFSLLAHFRIIGETYKNREKIKSDPPRSSLMINFNVFRVDGGLAGLKYAN